MLVTYVPWAVAKGVTVYANCAAHTLTVRGSRAVELQCRVMRGGAETRDKVKVKAKAFVVAAGAIGSSELLLRSGLGNKNVGHSIGFHPSPAVLGLYREDINAFAGIPMAYHVSQFASTARARGLLIEGIFIQPGQFSLLLPSFYPDLMKNYKHYTMAGILLHDDQTGVVRLNAQERAVFFYELSPRDAQVLSGGMAAAANLFLNTDPKPKYVITSHRRRTLIHNESEIKIIGEHGTGPNDLTLGSAHPQGGNRMGGDPEVYAVDPQFRLFDADGGAYENLFVCDASVFPTTVGVNPQVSVMAVALEASRGIGRQVVP
jgi:choline dehydrogenase-like flavoprotein